MHKGFGYGSLGAGRYGMSGGMGIRPPRGVAVPDFTTALIAAAMWGLTPDYQVEDAVLGRVSGSLAATESCVTKADAPYYCDIEKVIDDVGDTITVDRFDNQATGTNHFEKVGDAPFFRYTGGDPLNGISILNSGTPGANINFLYYGDVNGKPAFTPTGAAGVPLSHGIVWSSVGGEWRIYFGLSLQYSSEEDVATPDLVTTWTRDIGEAPLPSVFPTELLYAEVQFFA